MRLGQDQVRRSKEERKREEEQESTLREELLKQSDEDFWEEYDRRSGRDLAIWERKLLTEEKMKRKLKQQRTQSEVQDGDGLMEEPPKSHIVSEADWQAQRLHAHDALQQMLQEEIDEASEQSERTVISGAEQPQLQLQDVMTPDEAWHVKRLANKNECVAELQRYVMRVVQYLTYSICGRHAEQHLARIKGRSFGELLRHYQECIRIAKWEKHNPFLEKSVIEVVTYASEHADSDQVRKWNKSVHEELKRILRLQTGVCDAWVSYSSIRATKTIIISDGFRICHNRIRLVQHGRLFKHLRRASRCS
jgi:hypothetical protein